MSEEFSRTGLYRTHRRRRPFGSEPTGLGGRTFPHLFLVVLTKKAKEHMAKFGWNEGQLTEEFESSKRDVRLYKQRQSAGSLTIALPMKGGAGALLLKRQKEGKNYFCCVAVESFGAPVPLSEIDGKICHNLTDARVKIVEGWDVEGYLSDGLDCDEIEREVRSKKAWWPHVGGGVEDRKWGAYLHLYQTACEKRQMAGLSAKVISVEKGRMTAELNLSAPGPQRDR